MKSDKDLIREGNYRDALGKNYNPHPYYLIDLTNPLIPICHNPTHGCETDVHQQAFELGVSSFMVGNVNADWL
jgi:hypothetical protein